MRIMRNGDQERDHGRDANNNDYEDENGDDECKDVGRGYYIKRTFFECVPPSMLKELDELQNLRALKLEELKDLKQLGN